MIWCVLEFLVLQLGRYRLIYIDVEGNTIGLYSLNSLRKKIRALLAGNIFCSESKICQISYFKCYWEIKYKNIIGKNALNVESPNLGFSLVSPISELCDFGQVASSLWVSVLLSIEWENAHTSWTVSQSLLEGGGWSRPVGRYLADSCVNLYLER